MDSKCWFTLKQTHYPPPTLPQSGIGKAHGAICLGHLIPDLKHLDNVINRRSGPVDIPLDMPIYRTKGWDLAWEVNRSDGVDLAAIAGVPIAAAAGVTINLDAGVAFKKTVKNFWKFESLDTFVIQPTMEYIEDSIEATEVARYLKGRHFYESSSLFMITGITVARGAKSQISESRQQGVHGNPGLEIPILAEAGLNLGLHRGIETSSAAQRKTDFVWSIRLAKISKGMFDKRWSYETFSSGATYGVDDKGNKSRQVIENLQIEGIGGVEGVEELHIGKDDDIFVIGTDSGEQSNP